MPVSTSSWDSPPEPDQGSWIYSIEIGLLDCCYDTREIVASCCPVRRRRRRFGSAARHRHTCARGQRGAGPYFRASMAGLQTRKLRTDFGLVSTAAPNSPSWRGCETSTRMVICRSWANWARSMQACRWRTAADCRALLSGFQIIRRGPDARRRGAGTLPAPTCSDPAR
jgi:hypothetical protein